MPDMDLKSKIREIPDWPKEGINFKDITTLLQGKDTFRAVIDGLTEFFNKEKIDKVVGIDARGFLVAAPVAYKLNSGLVIVRKPGKLPYKTISEKYKLEYASNEIHMHNDAINLNERVILIDDLIATGGTALAACNLIEKLGGVVVGVGAIIDLPFLGGSKKLKNRGYSVKNLVSYEKE